MTPLPSIRQRLARVSVAVVLVWSVAASAVVWLVVHHELDELLDGSLRESAQVLHGLLSANVLPLPLAAGASMPAPPHTEDLVWQIVDRQGQVLLRSHQAPDQALVATSVRGFADVDGAWRVHAQSLGEQGGVLQVAQRDSERREALVDISGYTAAAALAVGMLCALWLRAAVRRELIPISELSAAVAGFDPLQPGATLPPARRAEMLPLRSAVADLSARLARRVASERAFAGHAAHALRTPLAGMVAQLAAAQRKAPDEAQPMLALARQAADRLRRVVEALLALFRSGSEPNWQPVDLQQLVGQLQVDGLIVTSQASPGLQADPDLLAAALANVLDNAVKHGATQLAVSLRWRDGEPCIVLADNGPGMSDAQRLRLQAAVETQAQQGTADPDAELGLGLVMADLVARAHGGGLRLPRVACGCTVELHLAAPPAPRQTTPGR